MTDMLYFSGKNPPYQEEAFLKSLNVEVMTQMLYLALKLG